MAAILSRPQCVKIYIYVACTMFLHGSVSGVSLNESQRNMIMWKKMVIMSHFCMCNGSWAVTMHAKLWHDWIEVQN